MPLLFINIETNHVFTMKDVIEDMKEQQVTGFTCEETVTKYANNQLELITIKDLVERKTK